MIPSVFKKIYTLLLLITGASSAAYAQEEPTEPRVKIFGNVYGGGELSQVIAPSKEVAEAQLIQDADLADLFTIHADHVYTTYVHLGDNSEVYGRVFGGGKGQEDSFGESAGRVTGQTDVALDGATVWGELFGGGQMADVRGNTLLHFKKGKAGHNAFGGGLGVLGGIEGEPDNRRPILASADIKFIPAHYDLIINDNATNLSVLQGFYNADGTIKDPANWMSAKKTGESFVVFDGSEETGYTHYEFKKARTFVIVDGKPKVTETDQYNPSRPEQLFSINHNIYGGGMTASKVEGKTFVHVNYGMVNDEMMNYKVNEEKVWDKVYGSIANAQFCVFGGGYGYHTDIYGDANVTFDIEGSGQFKYLSEFKDDFETKESSWTSAEAIYTSAEAARWSHGAPGRSCMDIVGGGYNGRVLGTANVTVGGDVVVRKVYGGGYYSSVGNTNLNIRSGIFNRIYGGGMIGNVYGMATTTIGQTGTSDEIKKHNSHLLVKDAIYGGNDVSGTVGTTNPGSKTITRNDVTYNVFDPVDDDTHGVRLNIYGGLVLGDVYGAGNGNHPGYGNPDFMEFSQSQHPSENYRQLAHAGLNGMSLVYKYRPRTARVVMNIKGNDGTDFNDASTTDKVRIWGRTFGGGNSCNVGIWDGTQDDNTEEYTETGWHPGDNFEGGGTIQINIGSNVQLGNRNDSHTTPNGLFMGSNGEYMITQHTDKELAKYYHQYYDSKAGKYYPGFVVYEDDAVTPIKRSTGLKAFHAFINNILTKSDNVKLNIANDAQNVWMSNFVGGGYRGSMQAATENGSFRYELPEGVTVGHSVVGGAFNAHIIYRVYATEYGDGTYKTDANGNYLYETVEPSGGVKSKDEVEPGEDYDYIKKLYAEGHEGDENYLEGYLRYNFDGGMLAHDSEMNATNIGSRIHQIHTPTDYEHADFTCDGGYMDNKGKALVHLNLKNRLHPVVHEADAAAGTDLNVHGGIVYGGCFLTGYVEGDSWVDYDCSLSPLCTDTRFFSKENTQIYDEVADLARNNALNVFGAGYGVDTHSMGDVYLCIKSIGQNTGDENSNNPFIYNVFGGSNMGTVGGSTNVYYDGGKQGTMLGSLYGGGYKGDIEGNTYVELVQGFLVNVYGGSRQANIKGAAHVWAYDGSTRASNGIADDEYNHLIVCNMYGGNDISGTISGTMPATWTKQTWTDLEGKNFNSYIQVSGTNSGTKGFPLIGNVFGGGNGEKWSEDLGAAPNVGTSLLEINGGTTLRAFGGGNQATVTDDAYIFVNAIGNNFADVSFTDYQKGILQDKFFRGVHSGYKWNGDELVMEKQHVFDIFGGNNVATMSIQPKWNLKSGFIGNAYSGGNMGDMTYYNALGGTSGHETESKGLSITVNSEDIHIESLYGGCRMSDVRAMNGNNPVIFAENEYGATVNILAGYINNVYGGNDVSGSVVNGTNVNISGAVSGNVYGSGNGNYFYKWDDEVTKVTECYNDDDKGKFTYYKVPAYYGAKQANDAEKLLTINHWRPSVTKAYLKIEGQEDRVAFVKGNVYCGGNASTVEGISSKTKFDIGSYVTLNGVFMGSDGKAFSTSENIRRFESLNEFNMTDGVTWPATWTDNTGTSCIAAVEEEDKQFYPYLLSLYMKAVEMKALPEGFQSSLDQTRTNAYIGTFCGGGNCGSMIIGETVNMSLPSNITIYDKVVAGCLDANVGYKNGTTEVTSVGGYYRPMKNAERTKLNYTVECKFTPMVMDVPANMLSGTKNEHGENFVDAKARGFLYPNVGKAKIRNTEVDAYNVGCNIYGGCYHSGDVLGDVKLNVKSALLEVPLADAAGISLLNNTIKAEVAAFNIYGAGFDMGSHVYGNVTITLDNTPAEGILPEFNKLTCPSVSNINGGGRSGYLYGNSYINILNGIVYNNVIGGSDAGYLYGSTHIAVGDPMMYECNTQGDYTLDRADKWNDDKINHDGTKPVSTSLKLLVGDRVSEAVYNKISISDKTKFIACYVPGSTAGSRLNWTNRKIHIGAGIYAGGYAMATGSSVYAGDFTVRKINETNRWKDVASGATIEGIDDYAGNANIMIADDPVNVTSGTIDHISISTIVAREKSGMSSKMGYFTRTDTHTTDALGNTIYSYDHQSAGAPVVGATYYELSGDGGIYGDGHLSFVEGFRSADVQRYGYAEHTPQDPKLLNTLQRLDFVRLQDCCVMLQGATDFAVNANSGTTYSIARVQELYLESNINSIVKLDAGIKNSDTASADRRHDLKRSRNYLGFFNNVHYIGSIATNDDYSLAKYHDAEGNYVEKTYLTNKQEYISSDYDEVTHVVRDGDFTTGVTHFDHFKQRNIGTARNMIGINNGYTLKIQNVYTTADKLSDGSFVNVKDHIYYGPIVGVCEVKLLTLVVGEGGGYVYADNVHNDGSKFMNTSGNFVFPGTVDPENPQYVVDDCFPKNFAGTQTSTIHQNPEAYDSDRPAHYWYVMGNKYFFTNTITAYTFGDEDFNGAKDLHFDMDNLDQIITLSGTQKDDVIRIKNVKWEHPHGSHYTQSGQSCDIDDPSKLGYSLFLSTSTSDKYNREGGYTILPRTNSVDPVNLTYDVGKDNGQESPLLAIRLNDSQVNNTADYWRDHLSDPCRVTFELESGIGDPSNIYTYHITLDIVYVQGPRVSGTLTIDNCAMPGELIHAEAKNLVIETDEAMPVTGTSWRLVNPDNTVTEEKEKYVYVTSYNRYIDHSKADLLAQYRYNGWGVQYVVNASGNSFPVSLDAESPFNSLLVHNYHDMSRVNAMKESAKDGLAPQAGARIYIRNKAGWDAFVAYLNAATADNAFGIPEGLAGMKFYLQGNINLDAAPVFNVPFKGELNGDGYSIGLPTSQKLFATGKLDNSASVYNLGIINGTGVKTEGDAKVENCFTYTAADADNPDFLYGKNAYALSHNYHTDDPVNGYINGNRYVGDWQYARLASDDGRMLRTADPYYGSVETRHNTDHTVAAIDPHDCLFFGQTLSQSVEKKYPEHIDDDISGSTWREVNRVYRTVGYYRSANRGAFHYNKAAWALQPSLTAIDFSDSNPADDFDGIDDRPAALASFNSNYNEDIDHNDKVTKNLLVYHNESETVIANEVDNTTEAAVRFHSLKKSSDIYTTPYFHLVDKQNFNAPIAFKVLNRAWYDRQPQFFRNVNGTDECYANPSAWEGICLPFTAMKVKANVNGEITHFYGEDIDDPDSDDHTLHHEYWLNGMTAYDATNHTATFMRPSISGEGLFVDSRQSGVSYTYLHNKYFTDLTGYDAHYESRREVNWYQKEHTFVNYIPLTASVPYLISFPGNDFYEFSLQGTDYDRATHTKSGDPQKITFETGPTTINVSDTEAGSHTSTQGSKNHVGTYMYTTNVLGMNDTGSMFESGNDALPFRTFMKGAGEPQTRSILIMDPYLSDLMDEVEPERPEDELGEDYLKIWGEGRDIIIETSENRSFSLYGLNGKYWGMLQCKPGINRFSQASEGIYLVGKTKVLLF